MKDIEDALQRLDKLTQEEARMAAAEALTISRGTDDKVLIVDSKVMENGIVIQQVANQVSHLNRS